MVKMGHYSKRKSQVYSRGIRVISNDVDLTNIERRYEMGNFLIRRISLITLVCFDGEWYGILEFDESMITIYR